MQRSFGATRGFVGDGCFPNDYHEYTWQYPEALRSEIEVITTAGEQRVEQVSYPKGHLHNPMSDSEVVDKFLGLCQEVLTPQQGQAALDTLWRLEKVQDIGEVIDLFQV